MRLIFDNGPANRTPEFVLPEHRLVGAEKAPGVQHVIAKELIKVPVEAVATGFHAEVLNPESEAVFRWVERVLYLEFTHSLIRRRSLCNEAGRPEVLHIDPVDEDLLTEAGCAIDGLAPLVPGHPRRQEDEILDLPATARTTGGGAAQRDR